MEVALHPDLEVFVIEQLEQGAFSSVEEVFTEALFLLWQHNLDHQTFAPARAA